MWLYMSDMVSRPGQSQGLLYKQLCHWLIDWFINSVSEPFPPTALRRRHAHMVRESTSSYKLDYVIVIKNIQNPEGNQNPISGSKVTAVLLKGWICLLVELHRGRSAPAACAAGLFFLKYIPHIWQLIGFNAGWHVISYIHQLAVSCMWNEPQDIRKHMQQKHLIY